MKANELMIGDWVYNHRKWECPIVEIHKDSAVVIARHYGEEEFELSDLYPIPLTPEILEKNGWEYNNYNNETEYEEEYYVDENGFDIHINGEGFEVRCIDAVNIQLKYLHELQHTLRLCGIEKSIEL